MKLRLSLLTAIIFYSLFSTAQMQFNGQSLFGNEWVDLDNEYITIKVDEDGVYRINANELTSNGLPNGVQGKELQLFSNGQEVAIHVSSDGDLGANDYIEFYGFKNRGELDAPLYAVPDSMQLNPEYSMFSDTRVYYLTYEDGTANNLRFEELNNNLSGALPNVEAFYFHEEKLVFNDNHIFPVINKDQVRFSNFYTTEGYGSKLQEETDIEFNVDNQFTNFPGSKVTVRFGTNSNTRTTRFSFNGEYLNDITYISYNVDQVDFDIPASELKSVNTLNLTETTSLGMDAVDLHTIASAELQYARTFNANNQNYFRFPFSSHSFAKYYEVENFNAQGGNPIVIDINNNQRLESVFENGKVKFLLPPASKNRDIVIYTETNSVNEVASIGKMVDFEQISPDYILFTSKALDVEDQNGENWVRNYADFRSSAFGGSYNVEVILIEDVINQFGYGIDNHTIGIRNWANYMSSRWDNWKFTFIIGKAYQYSIGRKNPSLVSYVPTHGEPGSDHLCFANADNSYPDMNIGRLAAKDLEQIEKYFKKMQVYTDASQWSQDIDDKAWQKKIIHLSGGDAFLQNSIRTYLDDMADQVINSTYGAEVVTFQKTTSDPIQNSITESILNAVNSGCGLMTFFGHSAVGTFDFSIEDPSNFDNEGKNPVIISLGCHSGNIHTSSLGISEDFVLEPEKGAIGFLASSGSAFIGPQYTHGVELYKMFGDSLYGLPLAKILRDVLIENTNNLDFQIRTLQQQLTFHGDPAITLRTQPGADFTPDIKSFRTEPEIVSGRLDSFDVCFDIVNLGRYVEDTLNYQIIHEFGTNSSDTFYFSSTPSPYSRTNKCHTLPLNIVKAAGENTIEVYLDHNNEINELPGPQAEMNNSLREVNQIDGFTFFVINDNPIPFHPQEFAITNEQNITLMASTGNGFNGIGFYDIEIDTTELFNSPIKQSSQIESNGGLVRWQPNMNYLEEQVYYWRVKSADPEFNLSFWNTSSFIFMEEFDSGWNQSHIYQWQKDEMDNVAIDSVTRNFDYGLTNYEFKVTNQVNASGVESIFFWNNTRTQGNSAVFVAGGVYCVIAKPVNLVPERCPVNGPYGADVPQNIGNLEPLGAWPFKTDTPEDRGELVNFLTNIVPDDYYVIMYTIQHSWYDYHPQDWEEELFKVFEDEGALKIRDLVDDPRPYVFAYQKGQGAINEDLAETVNDLVTSVTNIEGHWFEGTLSSTTIGPASQWNKFLWDFDEYNSSEDLFDIRLFGIDNNQNEDTLATFILDKEFDLSGVDAQEYPYLRLEIFSRDTISNSALDLDYWRIVYKELPEAVLNTADEFFFNSDTLEVGENLVLDYRIDNISDTNMDSMLVKYSLVDFQNQETLISERKAPVTANNNIKDHFEYNTDDLSGLYELRVEINPDQDQPEQYDFNNLGILKFLVRNDKINPLLDVTFDGIRILDGDVISPTPMIKITLTDENLTQFLENPDEFELTLENANIPDSEVSIDVNGPEVNFSPGTADNGNVTCLEFTPTLEGGEYILYVQGKDAAGNFSGDHAYSVSFTVVEENMISNVLNYPNPFSTSTQFIFTVTGNQIPQDYHIKIMTMTGKVVREITQAELGPVRIGTNRSEYKWDGRDEYGSRLANGVYIYKMYTDVSDDSEIFNLGDVDKYFKEGFGKLVIMR